MGGAVLGFARARKELDVDEGLLGGKLAEGGVSGDEACRTPGAV